MRANRGALGFSTPEAQRIFDGAYVVAPQAESFWLDALTQRSTIVEKIQLKLT